jgi:hypothetical protein
MILPALVAGAFAFAACSTKGNDCYQGDRTSCTCAGAQSGFATCGADGQLGACTCGGTGGGGTTSTTATGGDAGAGGSASADGGTDAGDGGLLPFMSPCTTDAQCETMLCWSFPSKGPHCSKMCTTDTDCPPPSPGCNPQMICRAP